MKLLALETSTEYCSVALWQDGALTEYCELAGQKHSELLMPMLAALLQDADRKGLPRTTKGAGPKLLREGYGIQDMDGIAYGSGPGSFTGVRIACGVAQGLALGAGLPVAGICTLQALAQGAGHTRVIAALDARMGEIYCAAYEKQEGVWLTVFEPQLCKPEDAPMVAGDWFGAGSGFAAFGPVLQSRYAGQLSGMNATLVPQAAAIAELAAQQFASGQGMDAALAQPFYLRDKVALKTAEREQLALEKSQLADKLP
jgi:tRNA threonylcarbamoyladenosine biosynthesis protein TsaB